MSENVPYRRQGNRPLIVILGPLRVRLRLAVQRREKFSGSVSIDVSREPDGAVLPGSAFGRPPNTEGGVFHAEGRLRQAVGKFTRDLIQNATPHLRRLLPIG